MDRETLDRECEILLYNIVWLRKHHGLSKKEMAKLLKLGAKSMDQIESGHVPLRMGVENLFQIWSHFGIKPSDQVSKRLGEEDRE